MQYPCIIIIENFLDCNTARRALALHDQNAKRRLRIPKAAQTPVASMASFSRKAASLSRRISAYAPCIARRASIFFITSAWMAMEVSGPTTSEIASA